MGMGAGLSLGLNVYNGAGAWANAYSAAAQALIANSGVLFLPLPNYCFTDVDGLVPAVVGDQVARINCAVGSGKVAQQATEIARPVLRRAANGGAYYLDPDGADCFFETDCTGSGFANISMIGHGSTTGNAKIFAGCATGSVRSYFGTANNGNIGAGIDGVTWDDLQDTVGWTTLKVVSVTRDATIANLYTDGVLVDTAAISGVGSELFAYLLAANNGVSAFDFWAGPWYGLAGAFVTLPDAARETVEAFFALNLSKGT